MFLLPKAAKGTKNALVAHPACDPLQAHGLNGKIVLRTLSISRSFCLTGAPHCGQRPPGKATTRQGNSSGRIATPAGAVTIDRHNILKKPVNIYPLAIISYGVIIYFLLSITFCMSSAVKLPMMRMIVHSPGSLTNMTRSFMSSFSL